MSVNTWCSLYEGTSRDIWECILGTNQFVLVIKCPQVFFEGPVYALSAQAGKQTILAQPWKKKIFFHLALIKMSMNCFHKIVHTVLYRRIKTNTNYKAKHHLIKVEMWNGKCQLENMWLHARTNQCKKSVFWSHINACNRDLWGTPGIRRAPPPGHILYRGYPSHSK